MTVHIPSAKKRSRLWFEWNATDCLNATDHALDALTGQVATFTRASIKTAIDQNGVVLGAVLVRRCTRARCLRPCACCVACRLAGGAAA